MESYLNENFGGVKPKTSSEEALQRWRKLSWLVKNKKMRFRFTANIAKREAQRSNLVKLRTLILVSKAALDFLSGRSEKVQEILSQLSDENLIKDRGSGKLYKVRLLRDWKLTEFAAWRLDCEYGKGYMEFKTEISMLSSLEHKNISSILEYYDLDNEKIIVYKEAFHGILDQYLCDPTLLWSRRLQICLGVARALNYIHYDVIHCDINTSKIFLIEDWEPKIFGFELSTKYPRCWRHRLRFPSYSDSTSIITPKYDVYCYGVLLFEVLCGKKPMIEDNGVKEELYEMIDPNLKKQIDTQSLTLISKIAYNCLNQQLVKRPTMDQIVKELEESLELQWKHENLEHLANAEEGISSNCFKGYDAVHLTSSIPYISTYIRHWVFLLLNRE